MRAVTPGFERYVPRRALATALQRGVTPQPLVQRYNGVALVVDIAGFSALAEECARAGPAGAERLSEILDCYFGGMTDIAIEHGGDVVDFVGDAMLTTWSAEDLPPDVVARLAIQCGLCFREALPGIAAATGTHLAQRIGVAGGALVHMEVGGIDNKWYVATGGLAVSEAASAYQDSTSGEVVLTDTLWEAVAAFCEGRMLPTGRFYVDAVGTPAPLPAVTPANMEVGLPGMCERYIPEPLLERMRVGSGRWLGEFRNASTLFVGFPGLDLNTHRGLERLQGIVECMQQVHRQCGGTLTRISMDDKGVSALSAFGLPLTASEDDAVRAILAAFMLVQVLAERDESCSIGITTGRIFCGDSGGTLRRHMGLVGTKVNLAARLMTAARGAILCDEATRRAAEESFSFEPYGSVSVKGFADAIAVWMPQSRLTPVLRRFEGPLIARDRERIRLDEVVEALATGRGGFVILRGEPGIGKSRLIATAIEASQRRGVRVLSSFGTAIDSSNAYSPWRQVLAQIIGGAHLSDDAAARGTFERLLGSDPQALAWMPLLNDALPLRIPENSVTQQMSGQARASSLHELLRRLLTCMVRSRPILLVADDLHWFDSPSAIALGTVLGVPGLLILAAARPLKEGIADPVSRLIAEAGDNCMELDALTRDAITELICRKLGTSCISEELADFVFTRTAGNPFYVEELVLALRAAKLIEETARGTGLNSTVQRSALEALPDNLRGVIVSRVDRLGAVEQFALKIASVIGREFSLRMIAELYPSSGKETELAAAMQTLRREEIVTVPPPGAMSDYAFKHAILQDVIYDQLPLALRRELHARTAVWIEQHEASNIGPHYSALALHWERSAEIAKAVDYLEKAAELSLQRYANREAIAHTSRAQALARQHDLPNDAARASRWEAMLGEAHHELFEYATAEPHFRQALARAGRIFPQSSVAIGIRLVKELAEQGARRAGLKGRSGDTTALRWASHIHERLAEIAYFDNRPLHLLYATLTSLNLAERSRATREIVDGFAALSIGFLQTGLAGLSSYYNRRSIEVAEREGALADVAYAHLVNSVYWANQGDWAAVEASNARATSIYRDLGASVRWQQAQSVLYYVHALRGLYAEAERLLAVVRASASRETPHQVRAWIDACELDVALARGEAPEWLVAALSEVQTPELHRADRILCLGMIARAQWMRDRRSDALAAADDALALLEASVPTAWHVTPGVSGVAEVYLSEVERTGNPAFLDRAGRACRLLRAYSRTTRISAPRADLLTARYAWLRCNPKKAFSLWRRAAQAAARLRLHVDHAAALRDLGERLPGADGVDSLRQAEAILLQLDCRDALMRVRSALSRRAA